MHLVRPASELELGELAKLLPGLADGAAVVRAAWIRGLTPDPTQNVWEWADAHRKLSSKASAEPGQWRTDRFPFLREPMEALSPSSPVDKVVVVKAAQMGFTEVGLNLIGFCIDRDPCSILLVVPSLDLARTYSRTRIDPMFELTPALRDRVRDPRATRDAGNTTVLKEFPGGQLQLAGSNSPAGLRMLPARVLILDDLDVFAESAGDEGDPLWLAERATLTYQGRRKLLWISTPTIEGRSRICNGFEESDKSFFHVPCPRCGDESPMAWSRKTNIVLDAEGKVLARKFVRFTEDAKREEDFDPHIVCEVCQGRIEDGEREAMIQAGRWVATRPELSLQVRGFHISRLYAPVGMGTLLALLRNFRKAKREGDVSLIPFFNRDLGEPWKEKGERPPWKTIYDRRERYRIATVPRGAVILTCGVDVQGDRLEYEVVGWGEGMESWSVEYGVIIGSPSEASTWAELDRVLQRQYAHEDGALLPIRMLGIDSGYATQDVYGWVRSKASPRRVRALKGDDDKFSAIVTTPKQVDVDVKGKRRKRGLLLWHVGGAAAKAELYGRVRLEQPVDGQPFPPGYCHFPEYGEEHFKQLTAEELRPVVVRGFRKYQWVKVHERNEVLDCRVYARACAEMLELPRWTSARWTEESAAIGSARTPTSSSTGPRAPARPQPQRPPEPPRGFIGGGGFAGPGWFGR
jgi:phage terminase large subunit GpA-like protein